MAGKDEEVVRLRDELLRATRALYDATGDDADIFKIMHSVIPDEPSGSAMTTGKRDHTGAEVLRAQSGKQYETPIKAQKAIMRMAPGGKLRYTPVGQGDNDYKDKVPTMEEILDMFQPQARKGDEPDETPTRGAANQKRYKKHQTNPADYTLGSTSDSTSIPTLLPSVEAAEPGSSIPSLLPSVESDKLDKGGQGRVEGQTPLKRDHGEVEVGSNGKGGDGLSESTTRTPVKPKASKKPKAKESVRQSSRRPGLREPKT